MTESFQINKPKIALWKNLKEKKGTQTAHSFFWLSFSLFVTAFFILVAIRPTILTIAQLNKEIKEKTKANEILQKKIDSLVAAQNVYVKYANKLSLVEEVLPQRSHFGNFSYYLETASSSSGNLLVSFNIAKSAEGKKLSGNSLLYSSDFSLQADGNFASAKDLIDLLETSKRIVNLETFSLSANQKKEEAETSTTPSLKSEIKGKIFWLKQKK